MFILPFSGFGLALTTSIGCSSRKVERISPKEQTDVSGRWNDTDSRLVANEMIKDVMERPWRTNFEERKKRKPVVIVGTVRNKSHETY